jgi:hypothetical protein
MERVAVMQKIVDKIITQKEAGQLLNLCVRQVGRLKKDFLVKGATGLVPKAKSGRPPILQEYKDQVMGFVKEKYYDFGPEFAAQKLREVHGLKLSRETLRQWMIQEGLWVPQKIKKIKVHQSRNPRKREGELIQIDGSHHDWFEGRGEKSCLLVFIDDATGKIIGMRFEKSETTLGYMRCVEETIKAYGRPVAYYSDRHSIFRTTRDADNLYQETQFKKSLTILKIDLICAYSPQAKGRVERCNKTLQDRLIKEMRLLGISSMEEANAYLPTFIKKFNAQFGKEPALEEKAYRPLNHTGEELELILSCKEERKLSKNLEFSLENKKYQIQNVGKGYRLQGKCVEILELMNGETRVMCEGKPLEYKILEQKKGPLMADSKDINRVVDSLVKDALIAA